MRIYFSIFIIIASACEMIYCIIQWKDVTHTLRWEYTINKYQCEKDSIADFYDAVAQVVSKGNETVWSYVNAYKDNSTLVYECGQRLLDRYNELTSKNGSVFADEEANLIRSDRIYRFLCACMIMIDSWYHWVDLQGASIISAIYKAAGGDVVEAIGEKSTNKPLNRITYP